MRSFFIVPITACILATTISAVAAAGELYRGPYLQQATPDSVVVVWRTEGPSEPELRYGDSADDLSNSVSGDAVTLRVSADVEAGDDVPLLYKQPEEEKEPRRHDPSTAPNTYQYEANVAGLQPNTKYFYAVYDGDTKFAGGDEDHYFVTSPPHGSDADLRIWVVGDSGTGGRDQKEVHEAMEEFVAETGRPLDLYMHVGDMAYGDGTDSQFQRNFFEPYQATLRNTVCWPTMGNHEGHTSRGISGFGPYYDAYEVPTAGEAGGAPSGTEAYYSFDIADVHFICLDSHDLDRSPDAAMAQWLRADLEQAKADWLIAFWHHPPYTKGSHDSDREGQLIEMRENFMPILESGGVDLVLTGHSHIYERSMLVDGAYSTPTTAEGVILDDGDGNPDGDGAYRKGEGLNPNEGHVSIVSGHGGAGVSRGGTMPIMREIILEHGSVILDINGDTLTGTMVDKHGDTRDVFSLVKRGTVTVERIEEPWQPKHDVSQITDFYINFATDKPGELPKWWSVVQGNESGVVVAADADGANRRLEAVAEDKATIGLYNELTVDRFSFQTRLQLPDETGSAGLVFGYVDPQNYWRIVLDPSADVIRVVRVQDGAEQMLSTETTNIAAGQPLQLELDGFRRRLAVEFGDLEYRVDLGDNLPDSSLGFYVEENESADFLAFEIERSL